MAPIQKLIISTWSLLLCSCVAAHQYVVEPLGWKSNTRVLVATPSGWSKNLTPDLKYRVGLSPLKKQGPPYLGLVAFYVGDSRLPNPVPEPRGFLIWATETKVTDIRKIERFDAGSLGQLTLWRAHTSADDFVLTVFFQDNGRVKIAVYLRGPDADDLIKDIKSVKEMAQSVRVVSP